MTRPVIPFDPPARQLSPEQLHQIESARQSAAKIRKAVRVARFDGWTVGIFGGLTVMAGFVGLGGFGSVVAGLVMVLIAFIELRAADGLAKLQPDSVKTLSLNQVVFASLLILYALWGIYSATRPSAPGSDPMTAELSKYTGDSGIDLSGMDIASTANQLMVLVYGVIIVEAVVFQGGLAFYYFRRKVNLTEFLAETPPWILAMLNAGMSL